MLKKHPLLRKNYCFGCGRDNPQGMRLKFTHEEGNRFVAHFRLSRRFTGPPGHAHGGVIAAILDEAMSKASKPLGIMAPTSELVVRYLRPVPLGQQLTAIGWEARKRGREHFRLAEIRSEAGEVLSSATGKFLEIHAEGMVAKFLRRRTR
ncbi:MAG: PaaI family thioesterase [Terriglobales bacterium]